MHLGHLKAYWAEHNLEEGSDAEKELEETRKKILRGHLLLMNYALKFGYSYNSWKTIVNTMLEKDPGTPKIHTKRTTISSWELSGEQSFITLATTIFSMKVNLGRNQGRRHWTLLSYENWNTK
jgi:hypothetical protein